MAAGIGSLLGEVVGNNMIGFSFESKVRNDLNVQNQISLIRVWINTNKHQITLYTL